MTYNFGTTTTANTDEILGSAWSVEVQQRNIILWIN